MMAAGLKCDVDHRPFNVVALRECVVQGNDLCVGATDLLCGALPQYGFVANNDAANARVGRSEVKRGFRQRQCMTHPARIVIHESGHSSTPGAWNSEIAFTNSPTSSKLRYTEAKRTYATWSSSRSSAMTRSPMKREVTSF